MLISDMFKNPWGVLALATVVLAVGGCSRAYHRQAADSQVYQILSQKGQDRRWSVPRLDVTPDPRSRFFDPTNPDCPPLPPDDPAAQQTMECVYGMRGAKRWDKLGQLRSVENPAWLPSLTGTQDAADSSLPRIQNLTLVGAIELSLIHSREYQTQLENLYLAALNLTFERYQFDLRPSGFLGEPGSELFYQHQPNDRSDLTLGPSHFGIRRLFPTGAQFVAELANDTLWMFSGPNGTGTATTFAYSLVQPLLLGAGREIVLEDLTQSERNVLYAMRDFARFRKTFFVNTVTGGQVAGLQRFLRGFEFLGRETRTPQVGYFPLLLRLQQVRNLEGTVRIFQSLIEEVRSLGASPLDIAQLEGGLSEDLGSLVTERRQLEDRIDQYKAQLGLPPDLQVTFDTSLLRPFQFIDPVLLAVEEHLRSFRPQIDKLPETAPHTQIAGIVADLAHQQNEVSQLFDLLERDLGRLDRILPDRLEQLREFDRQRLLEDIDEDQARLAETRQQFDRASGELRDLQQRLQDAEPSADELSALIKNTGQVYRGLLLTVRRLSVIQVSIRVELVPLERVELDAAGVVQIALNNRLDLMNQRALVVDGRRQLEVVANQLESTLDLVVEGEVRTPPLTSNANPFKFRRQDSEFRAGLTVTAPLDRRAERNDYRATQIAYQRVRRNYGVAVDRIKLDVRQSLRTLHQLAEVVDINRRTVRSSTRAVFLAYSQEAGAEQGFNLRDALADLLDSQDELIESWLDFKTTRLNLFRDMGTMEIDQYGRWRDQF